MILRKRVLNSHTGYEVRLGWNHFLYSVVSIFSRVKDICSCVPSKSHTSVRDRRAYERCLVGVSLLGILEREAGKQQGERAL